MFDPSDTVHCQKDCRMHRNFLTVLLGMSSLVFSSVTPVIAIAQDEPVELNAQTFCTYGDVKLSFSNSDDDTDIFLPCDGRTLSCDDYSPLFSLIGTSFGGDGRTTFKLPDLRKAEVELRKSAGILTDTTTLRYRIAVKNALYPSRY